MRDQSVFIETSIHTVEEHLVIGAILAAVVVFVFLSNTRATVIAAISIPTSIISAFAILDYMGFTLNSITLLALTLSVGIVIDDAIVVMENIFRYIEEKGYPPYQAAIAATGEIGLAVMAITLSLVAVFLPIAMMSGIVGRFLKSFGITMSATILVSMLVSFTLTPMLASRWFRGPAGNGKDEPERPLAMVRRARRNRRRSSSFSTTSSNGPTWSCFGSAPASVDRGRGGGRLHGDAADAVWDAQQELHAR